MHFAPQDRNVCSHRLWWSPRADQEQGRQPGIAPSDCNIFTESFDTGWETQSHSTSRQDSGPRPNPSIPFGCNCPLPRERKSLKLYRCSFCWDRWPLEREQVWDIQKYRYTLIISCLFQYVLWLVPQKVHWKIYSLREETSVLLWWERDDTVSTTFWFFSYQCKSGVIL